METHHLYFFLLQFSLTLQVLKSCTYFHYQQSESSSNQLVTLQLVLTSPFVPVTTFRLPIFTIASAKSERNVEELEL